MNASKQRSVIEKKILLYAKMEVYFDEFWFKVYMTDFFYLLVKSTWITDINIEKTNPKSPFLHFVFLSKNAIIFTSR